MANLNEKLEKDEQRLTSFQSKRKLDLEGFHSDDVNDLNDGGGGGETKIRNTPIHIHLNKTLVRKFVFDMCSCKPIIILRYC